MGSSLGSLDVKVLWFFILILMRLDLEPPRCHTLGDTFKLWAAPLPPALCPLNSHEKSNRYRDLGWCLMPGEGSFTDSPPPQSGLRLSHKELPSLLRLTSSTPWQINVLWKAESNYEGKPASQCSHGSYFQFLEFWLCKESWTWQATGENVWVTAATSDHGLALSTIRDGWANGNKGSRRVNKALLQKPNKEFMERNANGELSNNILWDVSKAVISGKLIQS